MPASASLRDRLAGGGGHFPRMVEMGVDPEGVVLLKHRDQLVGDPVGQDHRGAGADADHLHVGDGPQLARGSSRGTRRRAERGRRPERRTSRTPSCVADVLDPLADGLAVGDRIDVPDLALAGAVPAVHGADIADLQQHPVGIAMGQDPHRTVVVLGQGIGHVAGLDDELLGRGKGLLENRIFPKICRVNQRKIIGGNRKRKFRQRLLKLISLFFVKFSIYKLFKSGKTID